MSAILEKIKSVKLCLMAHPDNELDSEFEDRISDLQEIENELSKDNWIKIESEKDLPMYTDNYFVFNELGISMRGYDMQDHNYWEDITHYQPIIKPNEPLC